MYGRNSGHSMLNRHRAGHKGPLNRSVLGMGSQGPIIKPSTYWITICVLLSALCIVAWYLIPALTEIVQNSQLR